MNYNELCDISGDKQWCSLKNNTVSEKMNGPHTGEKWINCSAQGEEESNTNRKVCKSGDYS